MRVRGFTLIEVLIALFVIALSVGALLTILASAADSTGYLRDKSFAQWIALNRITELRTGGSRPGIGVTRDTVEYAGVLWGREQQVSDSGIDGLTRIDVRVTRLGDATEQKESPAEGEPASGSMARAIGFIGAAVARPSGLLPDWSPRPPPGPGDGPGDGPGGGGND